MRVWGFLLYEIVRCPKIALMRIYVREKGTDLTNFYDKSPYTLRN